MVLCGFGVFSKGGVLVKKPSDFKGNVKHCSVCEELLAVCECMVSCGFSRLLKGTSL